MIKKVNRGRIITKSSMNFGFGVCQGIKISFVVNIFFKFIKIDWEVVRLEVLLEQISYFVADLVHLSAWNFVGFYHEGCCLYDEVFLS